ncbi:MAG: SMC-Scp complex subunit ScpB [Myxococcota bacterium]
MDENELVDAIEAILFAGGEPMTLAELKKVCLRAWADEPDKEERAERMKDALEALKQRWEANSDTRGFNLVEVAEGFAFRSNPAHSRYLRAMRDERPVRLSKAALETLAIVAYRQPATKPEIDHIRGVDCGGTLRLLIDRSLVRIVGKKEEPGRPLLYGTSKDFLSFFNISNLNELPSLREYHELNQESQEELAEFDGTSLEELSRQAKQLRLEEEPAVQALEDAVQELDTQENVAADAFSSQGIELVPESETEGKGES